MSLDIKKIYVDSRYKTSDSKSESEFTIDLPRSFNIPDDVVAYIDDIVLPISWKIVNEHNNTFYFTLFYDGDFHHYQLPLEHGNYNGTTFATALQTGITALVDVNAIEVTVTYDYLNNTIKIAFKDKRSNKSDENKLEMMIWSDKMLKIGAQNATRAEPNSINQIINLTEYIYFFETGYYSAYLDLHVTRNLYLLSSALASYDTISNFGNDTIIKKIPVRGNANDIIFDNASEGFDYLNVSRRTLRHVDFKLVDTNNKVVTLGSHWTFSIVFSRTRV